MPLPLILVGAAIVAGGYGAKKGLDAMSDFDRAKSLNKEAERTHRDAKKSLDKQCDRTRERLEDLGRQKVHLYQYGLKPFVATYKKIRNINYYAESADDFDLNIQAEILDMQEAVTNMEEVLTGTATAIGTGALVGWAVYGGASLVGTASTGTAIATLSGAAAKSATLAYLGGGSLASGGLGMLGGKALLFGGAVAPAALLVGGIMLASKAEEAIANALSNLRKAETAAEAMKAAVVAARAISQVANKVRMVLHRLQTDYLNAGLIELKRLVSANDDYHTYDLKQRRLVGRTMLVAQTAYSVAETPLLDKNDRLTIEIKKVLQDANKVLKTIDAM